MSIVSISAKKISRNALGISYPLFFFCQYFRTPTANNSWKLLVTFSVPLLLQLSNTQKQNIFTWGHLITYLLRGVLHQNANVCKQREGGFISMRTFACNFWIEHLVHQVLTKITGLYARKRKLPAYISRKRVMPFVLGGTWRTSRPRDFFFVVYSPYVLITTETMKSHNSLFL